MRERDERDKAKRLSPEELRLIDSWWRAANYLSVGQIYLLDNPLLREPLELKHVKPRLLGHWGTALVPTAIAKNARIISRPADSANTVKLRTHDGDCLGESRIPEARRR